MERSSNEKALDKPLVVDLDGTLLKTNLLYEAANNVLVRHPLRFLYLLLRCCKEGKGYLKAQLAYTSEIDVTMLPYNPNVLALLSNQKTLGRTIVLATANHRVLAEAVAKHLGLFDEVMATEGASNLRAELKRDLLVARFGEKKFDYIGSRRADLSIWEVADKGYVVTSSPTLIEKVKKTTVLAQVISNEQIFLGSSLLKAIRAQQWVKNLLLFAPLVAAHQFNNLAHITDGVIAFVVFCLASSGVYLFNDLIDITDDRHHRRKRYRQFASGNLNLIYGWMLWPGLLVFAFTISFLTLSCLFCIVLLAYVLLALAYSLKLKQIAIIDVFTLAILYTLRIIAGAEATGTPLSFWILVCSIFIFLSLAFIKRFSELQAARLAGRQTQIWGRGYVHQDLEVIASMGISAGYLAVLVLALYIQDSHAIALYPSPHYIWLACLLLLYWISRAWLIAYRGQMHDDPIVFICRDHISWIVAICFIGAFVLATVSR